MTAPLDEARLRELAADLRRKIIVAMKVSEDGVKGVKRLVNPQGPAAATAIEALLNALSAERERGDRAVEAVRARRKLYAWKRDQRDALAKDTLTEWEMFNTLVEGFDILETEILATQKAEGATDAP